MMKKNGPYRRLQERVEALSDRGMSVDVLGELAFSGSDHTDPYPLYEVVAGDVHEDAKHRVLISGGVHGDEPAGALAVVRFLEERVHRYTDRFSFIAYPCVNPSGYAQGIRNNAAGLNLNRQFRIVPGAQENALILSSQENKGFRYLFTMDMHETDSSAVEDEEEYGEGEYPNEYYLYESCYDERLRVGHRIIAEFEKCVPVCTWDTIADEHNSGGVIFGPQTGNKYYMQMTSFESGMLKLGFTEHSFTVETPTCWDLDVRIALHIKTLEHALDFCVIPE